MSRSNLKRRPWGSNLRGRKDSLTLFRLLENMYQVLEEGAEADEVCCQMHSTTIDILADIFSYSEHSIYRHSTVQHNLALRRRCQNSGVVFKRYFLQTSSSFFSSFSF